MTDFLIKTSTTTTTTTTITYFSTGCKRIKNIDSTPQELLRLRGRTLPLMLESLRSLDTSHGRKNRIFQKCIELKTKGKTEKKGERPFHAKNVSGQT